MATTLAEVSALLDPSGAGNQQQPLGEGEGAQGEAPKKRRRRKVPAGDINVALYIKQQQTRGPTRKWRQQWVNVRTIVGGGEVKMLKWVSDTPPAAPTTAVPGFGNFQSIQASRKRERQQQQQQQDPLSKAAAAAAAAAASGAERQWRGGSLSRLNSTNSLDPAAAAGGAGDLQQQPAAAFGAASAGNADPAAAAGAGDGAAHAANSAAAGAQGDIKSLAASIAAAVAAETQGSTQLPGDAAAAAAAGGGDFSPGPKKKRKLSGGAAGAAAAADAAGEAAAAAAAAAAGGSGGSQIPCPQCGRQFKTLGSLRKHMHVHQAKSFVCTHPGCNKSFADAVKLERHAEKHSASKDIRCPACDKCFFTVFNLRTHWKQIHKELPPPPSLFAASKPGAPGAAGTGFGSDDA